jgi:transcription antitermination factor NusG
VLFPVSLDNPEWYAVVVRPRSEKAVAQALANKGVEPYLPIYRGRYRSAGRFKDVDLPLFPQYVFCKMGTCSRGFVLSTPGVFRFVAFGSKLAPVDLSELESIRRAISYGTEPQPWPFLKAGDAVEIAEGPLRGLAGRLIATHGDCWLILEVSVLQRSLAVKIDRRWARPSPAAPVSVLSPALYSDPPRFRLAGPGYMA